MSVENKLNMSVKNIGYSSYALVVNLLLSCFAAVFKSLNDSMFEINDSKSVSENRSKKSRYAGLYGERWKA